MFFRFLSVWGGTKLLRIRLASNISATNFEFPDLLYRAVLIGLMMNANQIFGRDLNQFLVVHFRSPSMSLFAGNSQMEVKDEISYADPVTQVVDDHVHGSMHDRLDCLDSVVGLIWMTRNESIVFHSARSPTPIVGHIHGKCKRKGSVS